MCRLHFLIEKIIIKITKPIILHIVEISTHFLSHDVIEVSELKPNLYNFENYRKSRIQNCERSELRLHFEWPKFIKNSKNGSFWRVCENLKLAVKQYYQTGHFQYDKNRLKMPKFKCDIWSKFQIMYLETELNARFCH